MWLDFTHFKIEYPAPQRATSFKVWQSDFLFIIDLSYQFVFVFFRITGLVNKMLQKKWIMTIQSYR